jgi:DNA end-binding protein Ku
MVTKSRGFKLTMVIGGLLLIPVRLEKAIADSKVSLHEYHKDDMGEGGRKAYCKLCGKDIGEGDILKGLEVSKGKVVTFTKEELENLPISTTRNIEVDTFVEVKNIDRLTLETPYYLSPDEASGQAYALLMQGLKKSGKVAVGKFALRNRENLCVIYPVNKGLVLSIMCWQEELKDAPSIPKVELTDAQAEMMGVVISKFSKPFNYGGYSDKYNDALKNLAERKLNGEVITVAPEAPKAQQNLEEALKALAG